MDEHARGQSLVEFTLILPIALMLLVGILDMARVYTTMMTVESAVREAADYGAYGSGNWHPDNTRATYDAMVERACVASAHLTDYEPTVTGCKNPTVRVWLTEVNGTKIMEVTGAQDTSVCADPERSPGPCRVRVELDYTFDLIAPIAIEVGGRRFGLPESLPFQRDSVFAISDFLGTTP